MTAERLQQLIHEVKDQPPDEQDRVAASLQAILRQPLVRSDDVRPEVMAAFEQVMTNSTGGIVYLRDK